MNSFPRRTKVRQRARDGFGLTIAGAALAALLAVGLFAGDKYVSATRHAAALGKTSGVGEIYTGSILYMPDEGRLCRQILFDNHTGLLTDNGSVDCEHAAYRGTDNTPKQWSAARARVISTGFHDY
jgi:hypothetical protein